MNEGFVASRYAQLQADREEFLHRARECAKLTIPTLYPPDGSSKSTRYNTPHQSMGARGVNNIASKLVLTLFPPGIPNFKLNVNDVQVKELTEGQGMRGDLEKVFSIYERTALNKMESRATRHKLFYAIKLLVVGGNALIYAPKTEKPRVFRLDSYGVTRDPEGNILEIVTKESIAIDALPASIQELVRNKMPRTEDGKVNDTPADLFTYIHLKDDKYHVHQEICGMEVPDSKGTYNKQKLPWLALRWVAVDGEDYGRGHVEEYFGDLNALESLQESTLGVAAVISKFHWLLNPGATITPKKLASAENGEVLVGVQGDVMALQADKLPEVRAVSEIANKIEERLAFAFLLNTAIQRPGERVTAEEIRFMAGELEDTLGGVYSVLAEDLQLPFVQLILDSLEDLPPLPKGVIPQIVTGLDALGRGHDLQRLDQFIAGIGQMFGPDQVGAHINLSEYLSRRAAALGVDSAGLVRTQQEIQAAQQQMQMAQMAEKLGPQAIQQAGQVAKQSMEQPE